MRVLARGLVAALAGWVMLLVAAPVAIASPNRAAVFSGALVYSAGSFVCHQQSVRSFTIAGRQMPVCSRCAGLYASALAGGLLAFAQRARRIGHRARWIIALAAVPTAVSWASDFTRLTHTSNLTRASLALPLGFAAGWAVITLLREPTRRPRSQVSGNGA